MTAHVSLKVHAADLDPVMPRRIHRGLRKEGFEMTAPPCLPSSIWFRLPMAWNHPRFPCHVG